VPEVQTIAAIYRVATETHGRQDAFRVKREGAWTNVSGGELGVMGREIGLGLVALGCKPGDRVALLSETRLEWAAVDMGVLCAGLVSVPIYPTLPESTVEFLLQDSGAKALVASTPEQAAKVAAFRKTAPDFPVVVMDGPAPPGTLSLEDLRERGRKLGEAEPELFSRRWAAVGPENLATLIYTSGTTGPPKGVMLTHGNIASNVSASLQVLPLQATDRCVSFLPLSHIFERMAGLYCMLVSGACIAYAESVDTVVADMREIHPTVLMSTPRLYEKIYARTLDTANRGGPVKKTLFHLARTVGLRRTAQVMEGQGVSPWLALQFALAQVLVFGRLRAMMGGRLRFFVSGGAPLAKELAEFFYAARMPILEGYGLTETSPVLCLNSLEDLRPGTVGKPIPGVEIRIAGDGEILARGPGIMQGYYNQPEATADALRDGWFHTGDIGRLDAGGRLVITDRKKDLIVTAGGKNVAPQPIETALKADKFVSEVVVLGDRRPYLVALVVPNFQNLERYAARKGLQVKDRTELVRHPRVADLVRRRIARLQDGAASFETIQKIHLLDRDLEVGPELTPTLKVKRKEVAKRFHDEVEALYSG